MRDLGELAPPLDAEFRPISAWMREFRRDVAAAGGVPLTLALSREDGTCFHESLEVLPGSRSADRARSLRAFERILKHLIWAKGANQVQVAGHGDVAAYLARELAQAYSPGGARAFDSEIVGEGVYGKAMQVEHVDAGRLIEPRERAMPLGRHLRGCRVGFDLGGSDRKAAAVVDGEVVFSEEIAWSPYFESDPGYHYAGVRDSIARAVAKLPRLDAIGGSAAGVYVNNEPRVGSLFRGVSEADFASRVRPMFHQLQAEFGGVPFELVNDGEVTALAASMSLRVGSILGISMGTSMAAGYVDSGGHITSWLNELAFCPVDMNESAARDEWSGDLGCGVQYFSQQAIARLACAAGIEFAEDEALPDRLVHVQESLHRGDPRARDVFLSVGRYLGWTIPMYVETYGLETVLVLGRVTSGAGGDCILDAAREVLTIAYPELAERVRLVTPDEKMKRHGQAVAAASLPALPG